MNIIDIKFKRFEIYLKAQKYREDLILITNIVDLKIINKIILKYNEVSSVIRIDKRKRVNKIIKNKFLRSSARDKQNYYKI